MSRIDPIRIALNSPESMHSLGQEFAKTCLVPLVTDTNNPRAIVVAAYGDREIGKTVFSRGVGDVLEIPENKWKRKELRTSGSEYDDGNILVRMRDFGSYVYNERWDDITKYPRRVLSSGNASFRAGLDILEHAPLTHLKQANFVVLISTSTTIKRNAGRYFSYVNGINSLSYQALVKERFPGAKTISREMHWIYDLSKCCSVVSLRMCDAGSSQSTAEVGEDRYTSILPIGRDPEIMSAFDNFRTAVCSRGFFAPLEFSISRPTPANRQRHPVLVNA